VTNIFTMVQQYIQLEHDGFYDEKLAEIRKMGEEASWHKRLYLRTMDIGTRVLIAVRLRPKPQPKSKKVAAGKQPAKKPAEEGKKPAVKGSAAASKPAKGKTPAAKKPQPSAQKQQGKGQKASAGNP